MRRDKAVLVLSLNRRFEEAVHELQRLLVVIQHPAAIDVLQVQIEVTLSLTALDELLKLRWLRRNEL